MLSFSVTKLCDLIAKKIINKKLQYLIAIIYTRKSKFMSIWRPDRKTNPLEVFDNLPDMSAIGST